MSHFHSFRSGAVERSKANRVCDEILGMVSVSQHGEAKNIKEPSPPEPPLETVHSQRSAAYGENLEQANNQAICDAPFLGQVMSQIMGVESGE